MNAVQYYRVPNKTVETTCLVSVQACHRTPSVEYSPEYDPAQQGRSTFIEPGASDGQLWYLAAKNDQSSADMEIVATAKHRSCLGNRIVLI